MPETMTVWESRGGRWHWTRRCSGGVGVKRVKITQADWDEALAKGLADRNPTRWICPCLRNRDMGTEFRPGKVAAR